jgi:hypothetical protein
MLLGQHLFSFCKKLQIVYVIDYYALNWHIAPGLMRGAKKRGGGGWGRHLPLEREDFPDFRPEFAGP